MTRVAMTRVVLIIVSIALLPDVASIAVLGVTAELWI